MVNIKKLLIYPLTFVLFLGLSSNACDSPEDLVSIIKIPFDNVVEIEVVVSEEDLAANEGGTFTIVETINLGNDLVLDVYQDIIEDATLEEVVFSIEDRLPAGSADAQFTFVIDFGEGAGGWDYNYILTSMNDLDGLVLTASDFSGAGDLEEDFKAALLAKEPMLVGLEGIPSGVMDYKVIAIVKTTTKVGAQ